MTRSSQTSSQKPSNSMNPSIQASTEKTRSTPMTVSNLQDVPEYEVNPMELLFCHGKDVLKVSLGPLMSIRLKKLLSEVISEDDAQGSPALVARGFAVWFRGA